MSEIFNRIIRETIKMTPDFAKARVSSAFLNLVEKNAVDDLGKSNFDWYRRQAHGWKKTNTEESPKTSMDINERVWFLLDATPKQRGNWRELISRLSIHQLQDLAKEFDYRRSDSPQEFLTGASAIRTLFLKDFIRVDKSEDPNLKIKFLEKYDSATPSSGPYIVWGQINEKTK